MPQIWQTYVLRVLGVGTEGLGVFGRILGGNFVVLGKDVTLPVSLDAN
jgi:hypothetical protein